MAQTCLCIDVGGSSIKYGVVEGGSLTLREKGQTPTPYEGLEVYLYVLEGLYSRVSGQVSGIALSVPGIIDSGRGICVTGGSLTFVKNYPLAQELERRCQVPVSVMNDAKCAAYAESSWGALSGCRDGIVIVFGTGIGGALIKDGRVHMGKHFSAGEFSFLTMNENLGSPDNAWAAVSGRERLCAMAARARGVSGEEVTGVDVFRWASEGDQSVCQVLDEFTKPIARTIINLQLVYDPDRVAIGGGISCQPLLISYIRKNLDDYYTRIPYALPRAEVTACKFYNDANLLGAYGYFLEKYAAETSPVQCAEAADEADK